MKNRTLFLFGLAYSMVVITTMGVSPQPGIYLQGLGAGAALAAFAFGYLLNTSHENWRNMAKMADQAIEMCKVLLEQRDQTKQKLDEALDLIRQYQQRRHDEGEEWKNG